MKLCTKKTAGLVVAVFILLFVLAFCINSNTCSVDEYRSAVYQGVLEESTAERADVLAPDSAVYCFLIDGEEKVFALACGSAEKDDTGEYSDVLSADEGAYPLQNTLMKGYPYDITVEDNEIVSVTLIKEPMDYVPAVSGKPGEKTLKNFLKTACSSLGSVLYVYGGGWDFQDCGSSYMARTTGLSKAWIDFFNSNDANYQYKEDNNGTVYYPVNAWNNYYYAGLDCSGYVGWTLYNTFYSESLAEPGFVTYACDIARNLSVDYGFGSWEHPETEEGEECSPAFLKLMRPGDVVSLEDHVYIVIGICEDDSVLIINSTVTTSYTGAEGGGVQLCAINADEAKGTDCDAYRLVERYNRNYYPEWAERYPAAMRDTALYTDFSADDPVTGIFHWNLEDGALSDPDGYADMTAEEIMADIFS